MENKSVEQLVDKPERHPSPDGGRDGPVRCVLCGATAPRLPLTWVCSVEDGVSRHVCERCARSHIRAIEGRLDSSWW
ncbi:hypothetical protein QNO07_23270 [Streptomyces sp. 549]|uniref:hypothetical protein n=1 Tax=Streptomyces sp. 549 TaxID=3049076 RepID=UPI0024C4729A|nr:hypothetical protein [Streptomyces sp. 549]MDK1476305.1 hypothetical protein [Streptomyces sp. 549]